MSSRSRHASRVDQAWRGDTRDSSCLELPPPSAAPVSSFHSNLLSPPPPLVHAILFFFLFFPSFFPSRVFLIRPQRFHNVSASAVNALSENSNILSFHSLRLSSEYWKKLSYESFIEYLDNIFGWKSKRVYKENSSEKWDGRGCCSFSRLNNLEAGRYESVSFHDRGIKRHGISSRDTVHLFRFSLLPLSCFSLHFHPAAGRVARGDLDYRLEKKR